MIILFLLKKKRCFMGREELLQKISDELDITLDSVLDYFGSQHWSIAQEEGADIEDYNTVLSCVEQYFFG
jgi:hypothetical protein